MKIIDHIVNIFLIVIVFIIGFILKICIKIRLFFYDQKFKIKKYDIYKNSANRHLN